MNRKYEELALNAWPALATQHYDGWLLKYSNGYTKRANAVYPIYDSTIDYDQKIDFCEKYYEQLGLETTFKMNDSDMLRTLDMALEDKGYHVIDPTDVMIMNLSDYDVIEDHYQVTAGYDDSWAMTYANLIGITGEDDQSDLARQTIKDMLQHISFPNFYITFMEGEAPVAIGYGVVEGGNLGVYNIVVGEAYRGKGYGDRVMNAVINEGIKLGATETYLQVVCANQVAVNLYKKLGYEKLYTYWYRRREKNK